MKTFLLYLFALLLTGGGAYVIGTKNKPVVPPIPTNTVGTQLVETAYLVVHPGAKKGDTLVFQGFSAAGETVTIHFPLESPCATPPTAGVNGNPPQCVVTADVPLGSKAQYPYYVFRSPGTGPVTCPNCPVVNGICKTCCRMCQVVIVNPGPGGEKVKFSATGSGTYETIEVLIDETGGGGLTAVSASAYPGQAVTWYRSGTDNNWSITFDDPTACQEGKPRTSDSPANATCTIAGISGKSYTYTMTAKNGTLAETGKGSLSVAPPPPAYASSAPLSIK